MKCVLKHTGDVKEDVGLVPSSTGKCVETYLIFFYLYLWTFVWQCLPSMSVIY